MDEEMYCTLSVWAIIVLLTNKLDAVTGPFTFTLPDVKIEPVNISVSAFTEKDSPIPANIAVDPVTDKVLLL